MEKNYKPLLIVKVPVGKMTTDKAQAYMHTLQSKITVATNKEYNTIIVPSMTSEFMFEGLFAPDSEVKKLENGDEIKKIIQEYLKTTEKDSV